jgi:hypothetical protein
MWVSCHVFITQLSLSVTKYLKKISLREADLFWLMVSEVSSMVTGSLVSGLW